jgi:hypothetical protein
MCGVFAFGSESGPLGNGQQKDQRVPRRRSGRANTGRPTSDPQRKLWVFVFVGEGEFGMSPPMLVSARSLYRNRTSSLHAGLDRRVVFRIL